MQLDLGPRLVGIRNYAFARSWSVTSAGAFCMSMAANWCICEFISSSATKVNGKVRSWWSYKVVPADWDGEAVMSDMDTLTKQREELSKKLASADGELAAAKLELIKAKAARMNRSSTMGAAATSASGWPARATTTRRKLAGSRIDDRGMEKT
jgi:hypothetical protein